jgi:hypothetical protein
MRCPTCNFESDDLVKFTSHCMDCEGEPEGKWGGYVELGADNPPPGQFSEQLEEGNE